MASVHLEAGRLLIYDPDASRATVHAFVAQPTPLEERMLGTLFFIVEIDVQEGSDHAMIEALQQELISQYYQAEDFRTELAFERALQRTNERLRGMLGSDAEEWLSRLHLVIAVLKERTLHFTVVGRMHAFLVHGPNIVDILETSTGAPEEEMSALKIFTNIISGTLAEDDDLLFCTTSVLDYLSQEKLKRVVHEYTAEDAAHQIEGLLAEADHAQGFAAIILKLSPATAAGMQGAPVAVRERPEAMGTALPQASMEDMISKQRKTNELLNHSLWLNVGRMFKNGSRALRSKSNALAQRREQPMEAGQVEVPESLAVPRRPSRSFGAALGRGIGRALRSVSGLLRSPTGVQSLPARTNRRLSRGASFVDRLTPGRRRMLLLGVVLLILFAQSVVVVGKNEESQQARGELSDAVTQAREKVDAADAALLIGNESGARALLGEAQELIAQIPERERDLREQAAEVTADIDALLAELRNVVAVSPELIYDLSGLDVGFTTNGILVQNDTLYTYNDRSSSVYAIDIIARQSSSLVDAPSLESPITGFVPNRETTLYLTQEDGNLQELDLDTNTLSTVTVRFENVQKDVVDVNYYNNRLYTLDAANNQIFRHERAGANYGLGSSWIADVDVNIRDATSLAIDGSVYVAKADGTIVKLTGGTAAGVTFASVDPALKDPATIVTDLETATLFVLDPAEKRILEYSKDGPFVRQYTSGEFTDLVDLAVSGGQVYVLNGTRVLRFPIQAAEGA